MSRTLRPRPALYVALAVSELLFLAGAVFSHVYRGWSLTTLAFDALALAGLLGFIELGTTRVTMSDDSIEMGSMWKRRRLNRADIRRVTWEKGAGVAIELSSGGWVKLPDLGFNAQGLTNTIRAWLARDASGRRQGGQQ